MRAMTMILALAALPAMAGPDAAHREKGERIAAAAAAYLRSAQDEKTGGWTLNPDGPTLPAITGLALKALLMDDAVDATDPDLARAVDFIISHQKPSGGIYDTILPSYNTAISVSALTQAGTPEAMRAARKAEPFLRGLQWGESAVTDGEAASTTGRVGEDHPFYGGVGYGGHGRPDGSNLHFFVQAIQDLGADANDPAIQRAVVFTHRLQMQDEVNDMAYADGSSQGGMIYATGPEGDQIGEGESKAGTIVETVDDGTRVSRLRAYGSMTYAGFKTYVYADLKRDDPRVTAALDWIRDNYTLKENPGLGPEGMYYFFLTFAGALDAFGQTELEVRVDGSVERRNWANDLIDRLGELQKPDGSFTSVHDRWMEGEPVLITSYSLTALRRALDED